MSNQRLIPLLVLLGAIALVLPACGGGGGKGLRVENDPVLVTSTSLPPVLSGEAMNHVIPIEGGCGGPYVLQVIEGKMPAGLVLDNETHSIMGAPLEDGSFDFVIDLKDTGCTPFSSTTATFSMEVGIGDIVVVDALVDGNPSLLPPGSTSYNPDYPALPRTVYNDFRTIQLVVAGGNGPYSMSITDLDGVDDGPLPLGASIPPNSTSITGAPVELGPDAGPFLISVEITDSVGGKGVFTAYWLVETPPIIIATTDLPDGECGINYSQTFIAVEGVPPFWHEFSEGAPVQPYEIDANPDPVDPTAAVIFNPVENIPPDVTPANSLTTLTSAIYAGSGEGPNYDVDNPGAPPEGLFLNETSGAFFGIPRRRGTFLVNYHVRSDLVPNNYGQHAWKSFTFSMAPPGSFAQDPSYTLEGAPFATEDPYNRVPDIEVGAAYDHQFLASGGVPTDGYQDHPHVSQRDADTTPEIAGTYIWTMDWGTEGMIPGVEFDLGGVLAVVDPTVLQTSQLRDMFPTAMDQALPASIASTDTQGVRTSVGPDRVIITESSSSFTGGNSSLRDYAPLNDMNMTVKVLLPYSNKPPVSRGVMDPESNVDGITDLVAGQLVSELPLPDDTEIADVLTDIDIVRATPNPTGWWDDTKQMNPKAARGLQHGDTNFSDMKYYGMRLYMSYYHDGPNPESTCIDMPVCTAPDAVVTEDKSIGVYKDGAKMYPFVSDDYLGIFMVRPDTKIYVPFAVEKDDNDWDAVAFGDLWMDLPAGATRYPSGIKNPNLTISPDGRFCAMKLMTRASTWSTSYNSYYPRYNYQYLGNTAAQAKIVIFSLTGEKLAAWGDKTYKVIDSGSDGTTSGGQWLHAPTLTMTNRHLYFDCGNNGYGDLGSFQQHYVYRYELDGGASAASLLSGLPQGYGTWMQVPNGILNTRPGYWSGVNFYQQSYHYEYDAVNFHETSAAPHPFRVSADGNACAILAGAQTSSSTVTYSNEFHRYDVWVDFYDTGSDSVALHKLNTVRRNTPHGGGRGIKLTNGPTGYGYYYGMHHWGARNGPTSAFEISDDGLKVAVVVSRQNYVRHYANTYSSYGFYAYQNWNAREDIVLFEANSGGWASGRTVHQVTGNDTPTSTNCTFGYSPNIQWRFGALTFTADGEGLVFFGGANSYAPTNPTGSSSYYHANTVWGSFYGYYISGTNEGKVRNLLPKTNGGANLSTTTYYSPSSRIGSTMSSSMDTDLGTLTPVGGFLSKNREYLYIINQGAIATNAQESQRLIGVNIKDLNGDTTASGHVTGGGFAVGGVGSGSTWPTRRGFQTVYAGYSYPYQYNGISYPYYAHSRVAGNQVMSKESGWVFFGAHYQNYGPSQYSYASAWAYYGRAAYLTYFEYGYYAPKAGQVAVFDADVGGPVSLVTSLSQTLYPNSYSQGTNRYMQYIDPSSDGTTVGFVYATPASYSYYNVPIAREQLGLITGLELHEDTGALVDNGTVINNVRGSTTGRISSSVSPDSTGSGLYFAAGSSSNENGKTMYLRGASDSSPSSIPVGTKRFNVLHAGR